MLRKSPIFSAIVKYRGEIVAAFISGLVGWATGALMTGYVTSTLIDKVMVFMLTFILVFLLLFSVTAR